MKTGITIDQLKEKIKDQKENSRDFIIPPNLMEYSYSRGVDRLILPLKNSEIDTGILPIAREQLVDYIGVPRNFFNSIYGAGEAISTEDSGTLRRVPLAETMVNALLAAKEDKRMVRTIYGDSRAILSDRYKCLDNFDILSFILPLLGEIPDVRFESTQLTESKMYIRAVTPRLEADVAVGDTVQAGLIISNSEIGRGSLSVSPMLYRLSCLNGAVFNTLGSRARHVGVQFADIHGEDSYEISSNETMMTAMRLTLLKIRDFVRNGLETVFNELVGQARDATERKIEGDVVGAVEVTADLFGLTVDEKSSVLHNLITDHDLSAWGLTNAITKTAQQVESYDRYNLLEETGPKVFQLSGEQWRAISRAKTPKIGRN